MKRSDDRTTGTLRAAFAASTEEGTPHTCVSAERIWMAVRGELSSREVADIVLHTSTCGACAEVWRLAHQVSPDAPQIAPRSSAVWKSPWVLGPGIAAAAVLLVGVILDRPPRFSADTGQSQYREAGTGEVQPLVPDGATVRRDDLVLRWSPGAAGTRYDVRVMTEDLHPVATSYGLVSPELKIDPSAVSSYSAGTRLLWQVVVIPPDGPRTTSPTFIVKLQ